MESITNIDMNFSNGGGGHSATVNTVVGAKKVQTGEDLGSVVGEMGEINAFSNDDLSRMFQNFYCIETTTSSSATQKNISRRYQDKTSLILDSLVVLLRGQNCGPREALDFEGEVPYFSEVINAPQPLKDSEGRSFPFPSLEPTRTGGVICAGRIYNHESAAVYDGIKIDLVYNQMRFIPELSMNDENVSDKYKANPDLSQYDLKYGYTLADFHQIIRLAGLNIEWGSGGPPNDENCLFEANGSLATVVGSIASYFGYFWYINPENGNIKMINTSAAAAMRPDDYTDTTDPAIISATFTQSNQAPKIVNTYAGTAEKPEEKSPKDDDRARRIFFKRYDMFEDVNEGLPKEELGAYFALFNQGEGTDTFDKYTYFLLHDVTYILPWDNWIEQIFGKKSLVYNHMYPYLPYRRPIYFWGPKGHGHKAKIENMFATDWIYMSLEKARGPESKSDLKINGKAMNRMKDKFRYILCNWKKNEKMPKPSQSDLYTFLKAYFEIAGGVYCSNGYSKYKAERMEFQNMNNLTVVGPLHKDTLISDVEDLSSLWDVLTLARIKKRLTVLDIWKASKGRKPREKGSTPTSPYMFIAIKTIPKLERKNGQDNGKLADFRPCKMLEFYESSFRKDKLWLGAAKKFWWDSAMMKNILALSWQNYKEAVDPSKTMPLQYVRRKTRVNIIDGGRDAEEDEDDAIAESDDAAQKMSDLFDRFDYKYFGVSQPRYSLLNQVSVSSASGSTVEMKALRGLRGGYNSLRRPPASSKRVLYGLQIPEFTPLMNSLSISQGMDGIKVTISESTIKLIPPSDQFLTAKAQESLITSKGLLRSFTAGQRNMFKL